MTIESATYVSQLNSALPADSDEIPEGDNHIRLTKTALLNSIGSLGAAALTVTATQVNDVINKAPAASPALTGTPTAPTAPPGTNSTQLATTEFTQAAIAAVNAASGALVFSVSAATSISVVAGQAIGATNGSAVAATFPASPTMGVVCGIIFDNGLTTNTVDLGANSITHNGVTISGVITNDSRIPMVLRWGGDYWRFI